MRAAQAEQLKLQVGLAQSTIDGDSVEIEKKFAIAAACVIFVLLGAPVALRFPRGGVGLTIGVSLGVFGLYYVGLVAGEALARAQPRHAVLGDVDDQHPPARRRARAHVAPRARGHDRRGGARRPSSSCACASGSAAREPRMRMRLLRPLDRYVLSEFLKILAATALGFPVLVIVIDITESLQKYLLRHVPPMDIAKAYVFGVPETMFQVLPAAVLFATVFSIGGFTRHSEISAAKASGISFYRFIAPIAWGAAIATVLGLLLGAAMPLANSRRDVLLQEKRSGEAVTRANFTFATEEGRVYKISLRGREHGLARPHRDRPQGERVARLPDVRDLRAHGQVDRAAGVAAEDRRAARAHGRLLELHA